MNKIGLTVYLLIISIASLSAQSMRVMTYNLRYDNQHDKPYHWEARKEGALYAINNERPQLLGVQEALNSQVEYLDKNLKGYTREGIGRGDGNTKGEYAAIYFDNTIFEKVDGGTFWLSETPDIPSKGWDAACERVATWVKFRIKKNGKIISFINTHYDHIGNEARINSSEMIINAINSKFKGIPVILSGDLNANINDKPIQYLLQNGLNDTRSLAKKVSGPNTTYHDWGKLDAGVIDYIMVTGNISIKSNRVIDYKVNGLFLSDHNPVVADIKIK